LINGILGPGLIPTPQIFSDSGLIIPCITFVFFAVFSTICAQFIIEAMQCIPGNKHFQGTVEFSTLINFYFGNKMHFIGQIILYLAIQSANISSIIYSAQTMDNFIINIFKKSYGVALNLFSNSGIGSKKIDIYSVKEMAKENSPFGDQFMLVTLGYLVTFVCIFPIGFIKLQDNINLQIISFTITMLVFLVWIVLFCTNGFDFGTVEYFSKNCQEVVGVVMFNFAFVTTIPSWINIKKKEVSVQKSLWTSTITSVIIYILIGYTAAISFKKDTKGEKLNILSKLSTYHPVGAATTYIFSVAILMVSIPVFSIIVRNNLVQNKICGYKTATFFSHVLPWICVLPFQTGSLINDVINWTSLFFVSTANFVLPILIFIKCLKFKKQLDKNHYFTPRQRELLRTIHWQSKAIQGFIDSYPSIRYDNPPPILSNKKKDEEGKTTKSKKHVSIPNIYVNDEPSHIFNDEINESNESIVTITRENARFGQYLTPTLTPSPTPPTPPSPAATVQPKPEISKSEFSNRPTVLGTLPTHPLFISNYYKGIPDWIPCSQKTFAKICLYIISVVIVAVIAMNVQETIVPLFKNKNNVESNQAVVNRETPEVPNTDTVFVPVDPNEIENGVEDPNNNAELEELSERLRKLFEENNVNEMTNEEINKKAEEFINSYIQNHKNEVQGVLDGVDGQIDNWVDFLSQNIPDGTNNLPEYYNFLPFQLDSSQINNMESNFLNNNNNDNNDNNNNDNENNNVFIDSNGWNNDGNINDYDNHNDGNYDVNPNLI